jgi:osmotically-inducible protein OsmY
MRSAYRLFIAAAFLCSASALLAQAMAGATPSAANAKTQTDILHALRGKEFRSVTVAVSDDAVTLDGTVGLVADRESAEKKLRKGGVKDIDDRIQIAGPKIPDEVLQRKLEEKVATDRIGYDTTMFNAITVQVKAGVVTLGGSAYGPEDKDSALTLVTYYPGVQGVVDHITVDPLSPFDNQIRTALARAIYGDSSLQKYAMVPEKPIRIVVSNGHVVLVGVVDTAADKNLAELRSKSVANVFSVENDLQVPGSAPER